MEVWALEAYGASYTCLLYTSYQEISTPVMLNRSLWETSGHWDHYKNNMYTTVIDEQDFAIKPMNCPGGILVYQSEPRSYRDLPLRMGELGLVHRHEKSGPVSYTHLGKKLAFFLNAVIIAVV